MHCVPDCLPCEGFLFACYLFVYGVSSGCPPDAVLVFLHYACIVRQVAARMTPGSSLPLPGGGHGFEAARFSYGICPC